MSPATAYIGLGSNLGDRRALIRSGLCALGELDGVEVHRVSPLIETMPQGPPGQDRYVNGAAALDTDLNPRRLLERMLAIEHAHGRDRRRQERWGPRPLDLDLLMYDDRIIDEPGLIIPHPRMHQRVFVLEPLARIAPAVRHPILGLTIECLRNRLRGRGAEEYRVTDTCSQERRAADTSQQWSGV